MAPNQAVVLLTPTKLNFKPISEVKWLRYKACIWARLSELLQKKWPTNKRKQKAKV